MTRPSRGGRLAGMTSTRPLFAFVILFALSMDDTPLVLERHWRVPRRRGARTPRLAAEPGR
jgi:hypothetical protein